MYYVCDYTFASDAITVVNEDTLELEHIDKSKLLDLMIHNKYRSCTGVGAIVCSGGDISSISSTSDIFLMSHTLFYDIRIVDNQVMLNIGWLSDWRRNGYNKETEDLIVIGNGICTIIWHKGCILVVDDLFYMRGIFLEKDDIRILYNNNAGDICTKSVRVCRSMECSKSQFKRTVLLGRWG